MANLYPTEQGAVLRTIGKRLLVEKDGMATADVEIRRFDGIMLYGNVQFTAQALRLLLNDGIELALFSKPGKIYGQLTPPLPKNIRLRSSQFELLQNEQFCLRQSRRLLATQAANSMQFIKQFTWNKPGLDFRSQMGQMAQRGKETEAAESLPALNGIEGAVADIYFSCLRETFKNQFVDIA